MTDAEKKLLKLVPAARSAETATERFEKRANQMDRATGAMGSRISAVTGLFARFAAVAGTAFSIGAVSRMSDEYTALTNSLKVVVGAQGDYNAALDQLNGIAQRTRAPLGATVELFNRVSIAAKEMGVSQGQILRFTENIGLALAQQGGSAEQASGALFQLSQALGGSIVRAEEFNSIVEGAYPIALAAAKGIDEAGGSVAKLRQMMLDGKLTSSAFFDAILTQTDSLEAAFATTVPTIGQAFSRLREELMLTVGRFNEVTGASGIVSGAILGIANNMNTVLGVMGGLSTLIVAMYVPAVYSAVAGMVAWAGSFILLNGGIMGAVAALIAMRGALLATGVGALAVGVGLAVKAVLDLSDELGGLSNVWRLAVMVGQDAWQRMAAGGAWLVAKLGGFWQSISIAFFGMVNGLRRAWAGFVMDIAGGLSKLPFMDDAAASTFTMGFDIEGQAQMADAALGRMRTELGKTGEAAGAAWERMTRPTNIANMKLAVAGLVDSVNDTGNAVDTVVPSVDALGGSLGKAGGAAAAAAQKLTELEQLTEGFNKLSEPFDQASAAFEALDKLQENGIISNDAFASSLGRIEQAFLRSGGSAEQWASIIGKNAESVASSLDELGKKNVTDLGRSFADLAVDGKASFADLTKSIIKDLIAIAWQALVVKPLLAMMGIPFANGGTFGGGGDALSGALANAGAPVPFAKGGTFTDQLFNRPTPFKFAAGGGFGLGVMGEAGPEAVMPLTRGPDGALGVQMYGEAANGAVRAAGGASGQSHVSISVQPGQMFEPVVERIAGNVAVDVAGQAVNQMNEQLPSRVDEILQDPRMR